MVGRERGDVPDVMVSGNVVDFCTGFELEDGFETGIVFLVSRARLVNTSKRMFRSKSGLSVIHIETTAVHHVP